MRYQRPFTRAQRREASRVLRSLATTFSTIRRTYRPTNPKQRRLYRDLREVIEEFAATLSTADDTMDTAELNRLRELATTLAIQYAADRLGDR